MIFVVREPSGQVVAHSDDTWSSGQPSIEASLNYSNGDSSAEFSVYVIPAVDGADGETTLVIDVDGFPLAYSGSFGGRHLDMGTEEFEKIHVAYLPGGPESFVLLHLHKSAQVPPPYPPEWEYDIIARHEDPKFQQPNSANAMHLQVFQNSALNSIFVAPKELSQTDPTWHHLNYLRVLSNDADMNWGANDQDGDGVGTRLEQHVGTCDYPGQDIPTRGGWLPCLGLDNLKNIQDTDGDGLYDSWEIFGVPPAALRNPSDPSDDPKWYHQDLSDPKWVHLPKIGADPRHKDVFIELDSYRAFDEFCQTGDPTDPTCWDVHHFPYAVVSDAVPIFADGSSTELYNPDGLPGIKLHVDIGSTEAPNCGVDSILCGDWGGSGIDISDDVVDPSAPSRPDPVGETRYGFGGSEFRGLTKRRWGIFRHGWCGYSKPGAGGEAAGDVFRVRDCDSSVTFNHELGHTLGLGHGGHEAINCKPHYVSIMNYETRSAPGFSHGERIFYPGSAQDTFYLNPTGVCEGLGIGATGAPYSDQQMQERMQREFQRFVLPGGPGVAVSIDWNNNGVIEQNSDGLSCLNNSVGAVPARVLTDCVDQSKQSDIYRNSYFGSGQSGPGTPKLLRTPGGDIVVFYQDTQGQIVVRRHVGDYNTCREPIASYCGVWDSPNVVFSSNQSGDKDYARFDAVRDGAGVLFVFATTDGRLVVQRVQEASTPGQPQWIPDPNFDEEISQASIKPTFRPVIQSLGADRYVFFWGTDDFLWQAVSDGQGGGWVLDHLMVNDDVEPVPAERTVPLSTDEPIDPSVAIVRLPNDLAGASRLYLVVKTSLDRIPPPNEDWTDVLYLMEHDTGRNWRIPEFSPIRIPHYSPPPLNNISSTATLRPRHNVAFAWVPNDQSIPTFPGDVDYARGGRLFLAYGENSGFLNPYDPIHYIHSSDDDYFLWGSKTYEIEQIGLRGIDATSNPIEPGSRAGLSVLCEPGMDANPRLAGRVVYTLDDRQIMISPFSDGIIDVELYDSNDWLVMRDGICRRIVTVRCPNPGCAHDSSVLDQICGPTGYYPPGITYPGDSKEETDCHERD